MSTLLLSGWAQPADALAHLAEDAVIFDYSDYVDAAAAIAALHDINPTHVIGWSLGGQLALQAILAGAMHPKHLTLIAAPLQFVSSDPALPGMGKTTFLQFRDNYAVEPARTKTRFHSLIAKGHADPRQIVSNLQHHPQVEETARWLPWLDALGTYRFPAEILASAPPTLIIHGMKDAIVPYAQSEYLKRHLQSAELNPWSDTGHAPHLHDAERLRAEIVAHRETLEDA